MCPRAPSNVHNFDSSSKFAKPTGENLEGLMSFRKLFTIFKSLSKKREDNGPESQKTCHYRPGKEALVKEKAARAAMGPRYKGAGCEIVCTPPLLAL